MKKLILSALSTVALAGSARAEEFSIWDLINQIAETDLNSIYFLPVNDSFSYHSHSQTLTLKTTRDVLADNRSSGAGHQSVTVDLYLNAKEQLSNGEIELSGPTGSVQIRPLTNYLVEFKVLPAIEGDFHPTTLLANVAKAQNTPSMALTSGMLTCKCDKSGGSGCNDDKCAKLTTCDGCTACSCAYTQKSDSMGASNVGGPVLSH